MGQPAKFAATVKSFTPLRSYSFIAPSAERIDFTPSSRFVVGHEPKSGSTVRRPDARSRETGRPDGVAESFQVSLNKVEPIVLNCSFNLLTKDDARSALCDEPLPGWP